MKRKTKILLLMVTVITIVVNLVLLSAVWRNRREVLANINRNIDTVQTGSSEVSFAGKKGDRIKFSLRTTVQSGEVDFLLTDSKGNVVADLDKADALETYANLCYDDTYILTAVYENFTGSFRIKVSKKKS